METWISADRETLRAHDGERLNENQLPLTIKLESRHRHAIQDALQNATRNRLNAYQKGKHSYAILAKLNPAVLRALLPGFVRVMTILDHNL